MEMDLVGHYPLNIFQEKYGWIDGYLPFLTVNFLAACEGI
jgi:hypothetical protein